MNNSSGAQLDSSLEERATPPVTVALPALHQAAAVAQPIHENGTDYSSKTSKANKNGGGGGDQSPSAPVLDGMQFKIISRGETFSLGTFFLLG